MLPSVAERRLIVTYRHAGGDRTHLDRTRPALARSSAPLLLRTRDTCPVYFTHNNNNNNNDKKVEKSSTTTFELPWEYIYRGVQN